MNLDRKTFLKYFGSAGIITATGGLGALLAACGETSSTTAVVSTSSTIPAVNTSSTAASVLDNFNLPLNLPGNQGVLGVLDASNLPFEVITQQASLEILKGKKTTLDVYQVNQNGKSYTNPIIRVKKGDTFTANLTNNLGEDTTIHWHGLTLDWHMDGHPSMPVKSGASYRYSYAVQNRGSTHWYHPHPHKLTAKQAYRGLASFYIIDDDDNLKLNQTLDLKFGETDLPLVIQDKTLDTNGQLVYQPDLNSQFMGFVGETTLINLTPNPYLEVSTRVYRFRVLNGSNARTYRLAFVKSKSGEKLTYSVIGVDDGLLDKPYPASEVFLSPGERLEILLDLRNLAVGDIIALKSLAFDPMHNEMGGMGGMPGMGGSGNAQTTKPDDGAELYMLKLLVKNQVQYDRVIPQTLSTIAPFDTRASSTNRFSLSQGMGTMGQGGGTGTTMQWLINGKTFSLNDYLLTVKKNSTEIWEFHNETQSMPHPMHLHGFSFQVLERQNSPTQLKTLATYSQGRLATDLGWKDTVLVWPGETVRIGINFSHNFEGVQTYVTHCHVLEHEDGGMMFNYKVA